MMIASALLFLAAASGGLINLPIREATIAPRRQMQPA